MHRRQGRAGRITLKNGRNPDIVSAYSFNTGMTLATEACQEKSNEIKAVPRLIDKLDIAGKIVTADAMSMQKDIIDKIRKKGGDFLIELKANQRSLRYGVEDRLKGHTPLYSYTEGPELSHGRIETRTYSIYDGLDIIADKEKWGGNLTAVEYESDTIKKSTGAHTSERRLYVSSLPTDTPALGSFVRNHWSVESDALGAGQKSAARQDKAEVSQSSSQSRHNTENGTLCIFHLEMSPQKES